MNKLINKIYCKYFSISNKLNNFLNKENLKKIKIYSIATIVTTFFLYLSNINLFFASYTIDLSGAEAAFKTLFNDVYGMFIGAVSIIAVTLIAYNIFLIMTSKNQRKIDESYTWIKAIIIAWVCFMSMSIIIAIIKEASDLTTNFGYTPPLFDY